MSKEDGVRIARVVSRQDDSRDERLKKVLQELCELADDEGADRCAAIECEDLVFRELADDIPDVPLEERSLFWPVPRFPNDSIQEALRLYSWAVAFRLEAASVADAQEQVFKIAGLVEAASFYKGFYLAIGLAAGNCKDVFCKEYEKCQALTAGKPCRYPLRPRPAIEACGLDPESIARKAGWKDFERDKFLVGMVFVD
jgi:hypothetical protein